jgi:hypothetical protein
MDCPRCSDSMASPAPGEWSCLRCGWTEMDFSPALPVPPPRPVRFRATTPPHFAALRTQRRASPVRRGSSVAVGLGVLLLAAAAGAGLWVLLTDPEAQRTLLALEAGEDQEPEDAQLPVAENGLFHREFRWSYRGRDYSWSMNITESSYQHFRGLDRPVRRYQERDLWHVQAAYDIYVSDPTDDPFIDALGKALVDQSRAEGFSDDEALSFALAFVQSLPYTRDDVTTGFDEYPRYPVETLVENGGDCEDTSILYASLVIAMGYGAVMVSPPNHMGVGVAAAPGFQGVKYRYNGQDYAYAETTGDGYGIGDIPDEYRGRDAALYDLTPKPLFSLEVEFGPVARDGRQEIVLRALQTGSAPASDVELRATLAKDGANTLYDTAACDKGTVRPGDRIECRLSLDLNRVPRGTRVAIQCVVQDGTYIYDEADSTPWVPRA